MFVLYIIHKQNKIWDFKDTNKNILRNFNKILYVTHL